MNNSTILEDRSVILLTGGDSIKFLNSLITNDLHNLNEGKMLYTFLLNVKGRIISDMFIFFQEGKFFLDIPLVKKDELLKLFNIYKLRSDISITETGYFVLASKKRGVLDPRRKMFCREILEDKGDFIADPIWWHYMRIDNLYPDYTYDLQDDRLFFIDVDVSEAISLKKGCYLGQEVTIRSIHQGVKRKKLISFVSDKKIKFGDSVLQNGNKIGRVLGVCRGKGLALVRREAKGTYEFSGV